MIPGRYPRPVADWRVSPTMGSRLPHIEGARALAACSIVVYHVWRYGSQSGSVALGPFGRLMPHLPLGVTLFFTLSGFLLYRPFAAALLRARARPNLAAYLRNRALRILPAYWVILLITGVVLGATTISFDLERGSLATRPGLLVRDALFVQKLRPRIDPHGDRACLVPRHRGGLLPRTSRLGACYIRARSQGQERVAAKTVGAPSPRRHAHRGRLREAGCLHHRSRTGPRARLGQRLALGPGTKLLGPGRSLRVRDAACRPYRSRGGRPDPASTLLVADHRRRLPCARRRDGGRLSTTDRSTSTSTTR
jgi:hypothetical protein